MLIISVGTAYGALGSEASAVTAALVAMMILSVVQLITDSDAKTDCPRMLN